jgi:rhodanese-related sulfurtransferase
MPEVVIPSSQLTPYGFREVAIGQALPHLGQVRLVDVREPDEYVSALGHIPGAELVPLGSFLEAVERWDKGATVVLVCRSGGRSARAAGALVQLGFREVYNLSGGMLAWGGTGLPQLAAATPWEELVGEVQLARAAMAGGRTEAAPSAANREALAGAIAALQPTDTLDPAAAAAWRDRLQHKLSAL